MDLLAAMSLPAWGAWVEMFFINSWIRSSRVAPRVGSVD